MRQPYPIGLSILLMAGCSSVQAAAARDPMRCERDPDCKHHQLKSVDCVTQCVDNPACIDRCREASGQHW